MGIVSVFAAVDRVTGTMVSSASELVPEVGRTGAAAVAVGVVESGGQLGEPQARSVGQQPPPRLWGQDWKPGVQLRGLWTMMGAVVGVSMIEGGLEVVGVAEGEVVLDDGLEVDDVDGLMVEVATGSVVVTVLVPLIMPTCAQVSGLELPRTGLKHWKHLQPTSSQS